MKVVIIGGVAGGASAAARLRRLNEKAEIILFERGEYISFANCGLPYYIGREIEKESALILQTKESFRIRFQVEVRVLSEAVRIDKEKKQVEIKDLKTGNVYQESYDKLILSPGAAPIIPPIPGIESERVFTLRTIPDTLKIKNFLEKTKAKSAVIAGAGYIGIEMAENLSKAGLSVTVVELTDHVIGVLDEDMAAEVQQYLREKGISLLLGTGVLAVEEETEGLKIALTEGELYTDLLLISVGVKPESELAKAAGLTLNEKGAIVVEDSMQTSDQDIYAVGDAIEIKKLVTRKKGYVPLAGPANKQGRIAADHICGRKSSYKGTQGSSILKAFDMTIAVTGLTEKEAKAAGVSYEKVITYSASHAGYYPGGHNMSIKTLYDPEDGKILGAQIVGFDGVDKRCDLLAVAVRTGMTAYDLAELELCYAPPFSSAKDPVNFVGFVIENVLTGQVKNFHWHDVAALKRDGSVTLLDVRQPHEHAAGSIEGFQNIPLDQLRTHIHEIEPNKPVYVHCHSGVRSYLACCILSGYGYDCYNLSGGYRFYNVVVNQKNTKPAPCYTAACDMDQKEEVEKKLGCDLTKEQIKSVKGFGFLHNKGTRMFSGRIITENGLLTGEELRVISEAAHLFGNGTVTFTVRLTLEVPGIDFDNIEAFRNYLSKAGLHTGGTGSRVRPIVACKGTTCVYGLYDTQGMAAEIHKRFYEGYYHVVLPHKFKIAVGGCPNNCAKPDLNDVGIVGQSVPKFDLEKCKGCKNCGVFNHCPMNAISFDEGKVLVDRTLCNHCGRCVKQCPFGVTEETKTCFQLYIGGKWGKKIRMGSAVSCLFTKEEILDIIEKTILLFKQEGISGERFGETIDRLGMEKVEQLLLSDQLLKQKEVIQKIETVAGAKC